jgi:hypothetical protein
MLHKRPRPAKRASNLARTRGCGPPVGSCEKSILVVTPVKTGVQALYNLLKRLDTGFRRYDGKGFPNDFFTRSYPRAATSLTKEPPGTGVVLSSKFPPAGKQITLEACLCYPLPLYAPAEDEREVDGRSRSLSLEGRGAG